MAENAGFCFGVRQAVEATEEQIRLRNEIINSGRECGSLYTMGPLIHNRIVTDDLETRGALILEDLEHAEPGDTVVVRSHGEPKEFFDAAEKKGVNLINATCPFVTKIHSLVSAAYEEGRQIVIVGDKEHPEVMGTNGWCENSAVIINSGEEAVTAAGKLKDTKAKGIFIVCQTTIKKELLDEVLDTFNAAGLEYDVTNTICNSTAKRQASVRKLAGECDCMLIIGDKSSSNTRKLFEISKEVCSNTFFVEKKEEFLLHSKRKCNKIGIATGASTPESLIKEVIATMSEMNVMSMEELLQAEDYDLDGAMRLPRPGEIVNGTVHQVTEKGIIVDMGCKKDGLIPKEEVTLEGEQKLTDLFKAGDEIQAKVIKTDDGEGVITLSKKKLEVNEHWTEINEALENGSVLTVKVLRQVNGGVIAQYKEVSGFIPLSQLSDKYVENAEEFIGKELDVKVTRVDMRRNRAAFSHRDILKEEKKARIEAIWGSLNEGDIVEGKVMRFTEYGAFIDLGGIDGLLHISEISWGKLKHPQEVLAIGDTVQVKILSMNAEKGKISLGLKQTKPEPWSVIEDNYQVGQIVSGKVVQIKEYGAFVELEPGLDGLVHISEVAHKRVSDINEELKVGQIVDAKVLEIDTERKRISLSIKQTVEAPAEAPVEEAEEAPVEAVEE